MGSIEKKNGFTYFIQEGYDSFFKIGHTYGDVEDRKNQLQTGNSTDLRVFGKIESCEAEKLENELKGIFKDYLKRGEWYCIDPADVFDLIKKRNGVVCVDDPLKIRMSFDKDAYKKEIVREIADNIKKELDEKYKGEVDRLIHGPMIKVKSRRATMMLIKIVMLVVISGFVFGYFSSGAKQEGKRETIPDVILEIPAPRGYIPKIELISDYHQWFIYAVVKNEKVSDFGVTPEAIYEYWKLFWKSSPYYDSLFADNKKYQELKEKEKKWSMADSIGRVIEQYIFDNMFSAAYEDSMLNADGLSDFLHKESNCPFKNENSSSIDDELRGGHNECLIEATGRKRNIEAANLTLKKIRKKYPTMTN